MGKSFSKRRRGRSFNDPDEVATPRHDKFAHERATPPIKALNDRQAEYIRSLYSHPQLFVLGPAGTGKTWIAATHAADLLRKKKIGKVILTRPNVPCGRSLGYFPGTMEEKFAPWTVPVTEAMKERMGKGAFEIAVKHDDIDVIPFEVMRGRSWKNCFVLLDEAQNATPDEIKMFLTRVGEGCTVVVNGDISQSDLPRESGLSVAIGLIRRHHLPVPVIEFTIDDIVRSGECAMWVRAFSS